MKNIVQYVVIGVILLAVAISFAGIKIIDAGYRGVRTRFGEVIGQPLPEGIYFYNPITTEIIEIDTKVQKYTLRMNAYTKDVQQADLTISINYSLDDNKVGLLYKEIGLNYREKVVAPQVVKVVKDTIGKWEADVLVSNREKAANDIIDALKLNLESSHVIIQSVIIEDINYSTQFERAIEEKQIATQDAIKAKNKTRQIEEEANQRILSAKAEAESMRIRSQALSQNQNLVAYEAVQKWDGRLPVNMYGSAPVPFIGAAMSAK